MKNKKVNEKDETEPIKRNHRGEYLLAFVLLFVFENFMFHDWRIYEYYTARQMDLGVFDKSNIPITAHNMKLFTMQRTEVGMADFI